MKGADGKERGELNECPPRLDLGASSDDWQLRRSVSCCPVLPSTQLSSPVLLPCLSS